MNITDILNKSQRYAESLLVENGYSCYLLPREVEGYDFMRVGLVIRDGRVFNYKVG